MTKKSNIILFLISVIVTLSILAGSFLLCNIVTQNYLILFLFLLSIVISLIIGIVKRKKFSMGTWAVFYGYLIAIIAMLILSSFLDITAIKDNIEHNKTVKAIKESSVLVLSTDYVDVYISPEERVVYSVCDILGEKYIDKKTSVEADTSEFYQLYNVGIEVQPIENDNLLTSVFLYNPTPFTTTGCEYLIEYNYNDVMYVSRVFIAGKVDYNNVMLNKMFHIYCENDEGFEVSKVTEYFLFENDFMSFSTPYFNVPYQKDEFFYVRYNKQFENDGSNESKTLNEDNVKFVSAFNIMSPIIDKVTFYVIGETADNVFEASFLVMEVIYNNGTSDIAIIKDINAKKIIQIS